MEPPLDAEELGFDPLTRRKQKSHARHLQRAQCARAYFAWQKLLHSAVIESPLKPEEHCAPVASPAGAGGSPREALGSTDFESTGQTLAAAAEEVLAGGERDGWLVFGESCSSALELMSEECEGRSLALAGVEFLRCKVQPEQTVKLVTAVAVATEGLTNELNCRSADESEWSEPECVIVFEQWEEAERSCKQRFHTMSTLRESKPEHEQRA